MLGAFAVVVVWVGVRWARFELAAVVPARERLPRLGVWLSTVALLSVRKPEVARPLGLAQRAGG